MVTVGKALDSKRAKATHGALVESTRHVVRNTGALSPDEVAATAGMSVATFYVYFPNKDEALAAAFDASLGELNAATREALDPAHLLDHGLEFVLRELGRNVVRRFTHDAALFRLSISRLPESETIRRVYRSREEEALLALTEFVSRGIRAGAVRDTDPERLAKAMLISLQGYQNPLLLQSGAGALLDDLVGMVHALLTDG